jgi:hypothetical protein
MRAGDRWQIIGGMCAAQEPIKTLEPRLVAQQSGWQK